MFNKGRQTNNDGRVEPLQRGAELIRREVIILSAIQIESLQRGIRDGFDIVDLLHMISNYVSHLSSK